MTPRFPTEKISELLQNNEISKRLTFTSEYRKDSQYKDGGVYLIKCKPAKDFFPFLQILYDLTEENWGHKLFHTMGQETIGITRGDKILFEKHINRVVKELKTPRAAKRTVFSLDTSFTEPFRNIRGWFQESVSGKRNFSSLQDTLKFVYGIRVKNKIKYHYSDEYMIEEIERGHFDCKHILIKLKTHDLVVTNQYTLDTIHAAFTTFSFQNQPLPPYRTYTDQFRSKNPNITAREIKAKIRALHPETFKAAAKRVPYWAAFRPAPRQLMVLNQEEIINIIENKRFDQVCGDNPDWYEIELEHCDTSRTEQLRNVLSRDYGIEFNRPTLTARSNTQDVFGLLNTDDKNHLYIFPDYIKNRILFSRATSKAIVAALVQNHQEQRVPRNLPLQHDEPQLEDDGYRHITHQAQKRIEDPEEVEIPLLRKRQRNDEDLASDDDNGYRYNPRRKRKIEDPEEQAEVNSSSPAYFERSKHLLGVQRGKFDSEMQQFIELLTGMNDGNFWNPNDLSTNEKTLFQDALTNEWLRIPVTLKGSNKVFNLKTIVEKLKQGETSIHVQNERIEIAYNLLCPARDVLKKMLQIKPKQVSLGKMAS